MSVLRRLWLLGWILSVLLLLLGPVLSGRYFGDDLQFILEDPPSAILGAFTRLHPYDLYRPIQLSIVALSATLFGETTLPVRLVTIALHLLLTLLLLDLLRRLAVGTAGMVVALAWLTLAPLNAIALGSNDTLSLVLATVAGGWALREVWFPSAMPRASLVLAAFGVALLAKESALGYLPPLLLGAAGVAAGPMSERRRPRRWRILAGAPLLALLYLVWRRHLGGEVPDFGPDGGFHLGTNVPRNLAMLWAAAAQPVRTIDIFTGILERHWIWPLLGGVMLALFLGLIGIGLWRGRRRAVGLACALALSCAVAPVLPLLRVSELYAYPLVSGMALLLGLGLDGVWPRGGRMRRVALLLPLGLIAILAARGLRENARGMAAAGEQATRQLAALRSLLAPVPSGSLVYFLEPLHPLPDYSVYRMQGFRLTPAWEVERLLPDRGLRLLQIDAAHLLDHPLARDERIVTLRSGSPVWIDDPAAVPGAAEALRRAGDSRRGYPHVWRALAPVERPAGAD